MPLVLLLIDFQEEWRNKKSKYYLGQFKTQLKNACRLVEHFHGQHWPVIFTRHVQIGSSGAFAEGSTNAQIVSELKVGSTDRVLTKNKISPFYNTVLDDVLKELAPDELVIGGIMTNLCVRSAVSDAYDRGYCINVVTDACVSDSPKVDRFTFVDLKKTRPSIKMTTTRDIVAR